MTAMVGKIRIVANDVLGAFVRIRTIIRACGCTYKYFSRIFQTNGEAYPRYNTADKLDIENDV